ncbi:MAG: hypothetical protein N2Z81_02755 [Hydrogenothermaceae bacterium]|nr:hypothetical protein [Hydrogenothermaceae bacterium]
METVLDIKHRLKVVKIRFFDTNKFSAVEAPVFIKKDDFIVVETEKGEEIVKVVEAKEEFDDIESQKFIRKATKEDLKTFDKHIKEADRYLSICKEESKNLGLKMNLLRAYIPLNRTKVIFYYTAESRVDFRELVKILAKKIKMRIEMRQIGVRDGVQMLGAVGVCGQQCCCSTFLDKFETVNVESITYQNLPPTPAKFTGICGRLMCCLAYEKENYEIRDYLPDIESVVEIDGLSYTVKSYDFINEFVEFSSETGEILRLKFDKLKEKGLLKSKECGSCSGCGCGK